MTQPNDLTLQYSRIIADLRDKVKELECEVLDKDKKMWELATEFAKLSMRCAELENPELFE